MNLKNLRGGGKSLKPTEKIKSHKIRTSESEIGCFQGKLDFTMDSPIWIVYSPIWITNFGV